MKKFLVLLIILSLSSCKGLNGGSSGDGKTTAHVNDWSRENVPPLLNKSLDDSNEESEKEKEFDGYR